MVDFTDYKWNDRTMADREWEFYLEQKGLPYVAYDDFEANEKELLSDRLSIIHNLYRAAKEEEEREQAYQMEKRKNKSKEKKKRLLKIHDISYYGQPYICF